MTAYVIAQIEITDSAGYQDYLAGFMPIFDRHHGKLLATTKAQTTVIEGSWEFPRTVVMQFPDLQHANGWLADPDYIALAEIRKRTAKTNLVVIDGVT